jgi:hypothetical protein
MTLLRWLWANPIIYAACCLQVGMAVVCLAVMPFDHRQILGLNPWIKPLKFDISITVLLLTSAAFLEGLERWEGARTWAGSSLAIALSIESILITLQAARGVRSHLNISTPFDARVSMLMGLMAVVATLAAAAILGLTFVATPRWPPAVLWGVRLYHRRSGRRPGHATAELEPQTRRPPRRALLCAARTASIPDLRLSQLPHVGERRRASGRRLLFQRLVHRGCLVPL